MENIDESADVWEFWLAETRQEAPEGVKPDPGVGISGESPGPPEKKLNLNLVLVYGGFDGKNVVGSIVTIDPGEFLGVMGIEIARGKA